MRGVVLDRANHGGGIYLGEGFLSEDAGVRVIWFSAGVFCRGVFLWGRKKKGGGEGANRSFSRTPSAIAAWNPASATAPRLTGPNSTPSSTWIAVVAMWRLVSSTCAAHAASEVCAAWRVARAVDSLARRRVVRAGIEESGGGGDGCGGGVGEGMGVASGTRSAARVQRCVERCVGRVGSRFGDRKVRRGVVVGGRGAERRMRRSWS